VIGLLAAGHQHVGRDRLAERHGVALEHAGAARAARRQHGIVDLVALEARHALDATDQRRVAVDLEQPAAPGETMQVVDVLRDGGADDVHLLELDERAVAGVRLGRIERLPELAHRALRVQALLPGLARIGEEALVAVHGRLPVLRPQAVRPAKRRDAALDRQPRPRERDHVARVDQAPRRHVEVVVHAVDPFMPTSLDCQRG
jgi:hypothetical protein